MRPFLLLFKFSTCLAITVPASCAQSEPAPSLPREVYDAAQQAPTQARKETATEQKNRAHAERIIARIPAKFAPQYVPPEPKDTIAVPQIQVTFNDGTRGYWHFFEWGSTEGAKVVLAGHMDQAGAFAEKRAAMTGARGSPRTIFRAGFGRLVLKGGAPGETIPEIQKALQADQFVALE